MHAFFSVLDLFSSVRGISLCFGGVYMYYVQVYRIM